MTQRDSSFIYGVLAGAASATLGGLLLLNAVTLAGRIWPHAESLLVTPGWFRWMDRNLGLALPLFAITLVLFWHALGELKRRVARHDSADRIAQMDHLADIWISLFFGIGVIWTAIGMRNALLYALGDADATLAEGAFALLERMIDGGILVALSTTIVGGIGGYLMRALKTLTVGAQLKRSYAAHGREDARAIRASLASMNRHLQGLSRTNGA